MLKNIIAFVFCLFMLPACGGEFEDALKQNDNVFLYLYSSDCSACNKFMNEYNKLSKIYGKSYGFVKVDANQTYGKLLLMTFWGQYVPFVALVSEKHRTALRIEPDCMMNNVCIEKALKDFQNQKY